MKTEKKWNLILKADVSKDTGVANLQVKKWNWETKSETPKTESETGEVKVKLMKWNWNW